MPEMSHRDRVDEIDRALAGHRLIYFGTRGADARALLALECFSEVFCQIAPLRAVGVRETCLETMTKRRVDLDRYSIDQDRSPAVEEIRSGLLRAFGQRAAVIPYRPTALVASAWFPRSDRVRYLGVFHEQQSSFEHKPWVETQLRAEGVRTVDWRYYSDNDTLKIEEEAATGPIVLRANRSDGGAGITLIRDPSEVRPNWPVHTDGFLAAAPFLWPNVPLNVNGCVFRGGEVTLHGPSIQLIGIANCSSRTFGYCGNDFSGIKELGEPVLRALEDMATRVGRWLAKFGYIGAYGIDAMLHDGEVLLAELNPRFQGSSRVSAELDFSLDRPDVFLNHIAAHLGLRPPRARSLHELAAAVPHRSHVICHNLSRTGSVRTSLHPDQLPPRIALLPARDVEVEPEGILLNHLVDESVTADGFSLRDGFRSRLADTLALAF